MNSERAGKPRTRLQRAAIAFCSLPQTEMYRIVKDDFGMRDATLDTDFLDMLTFVRESGQREAFIERFIDGDGDA